MVNSITFAHRNAFQCRAIGERTVANVSDAIRNGNRCQVFATRERRVANARHAVRNGNRCQAFATRERRVANARHTVADHDGGYRTAVLVPRGVILVIRHLAVSGNLKQTVFVQNPFQASSFVFVENARQNLIFQIVCFAIFLCIFVVMHVN